MIWEMTGKGMVNTMRVWTKQHENMLEELLDTGRYTAKKQYAAGDLTDQAYLMLEAYDWLVKNGPQSDKRPEDAAYPVWLSFSRRTAMLMEKNMVLLELEVDPSRLTFIDIEKWTSILNYSYIPANQADMRRHRELLNAYGVSDVKAYMTQFYPEIKREIRESWGRLFVEGIPENLEAYYGNIWEVKKEWLVQVIR